MKVSYRLPPEVSYLKITTQRHVEEMLRHIPSSREIELFFDGRKIEKEEEEFPVISSWNCRGFDDPSIHFQKVINAFHKPLVIFIIESRLSSKAMRNAASSMGYEQVWDSPTTKGVNGEDNCVGLAILVKAGVKISFLDKTANYLDFVVRRSNSPDLRLTGFYGHPTNKARSWDWLQTLYKDPRGKKLPWIVFGDFYEILAHDEKNGGPKKPQSQINAFRKVVKDCHLSQLSYYGSGKFTWERDNIKQVLDKALVSNSWRGLFRSARILHLTHGNVSDHIPIMIQTDGGRSKVENRARALHATMGNAFKLAEEWEQQYRTKSIELGTVSNIVENIELECPEFYFDILQMIAPQVIHTGGIALYEKESKTVKYDRLVSVTTCNTLCDNIWSCAVIPRRAEDDRKKPPPKCPISSLKKFRARQFNLTEYLEETWKIVGLIPVGDKINRQEIINQSIDKQVNQIIEWLEIVFLESNDKKHFVIRDMPAADMVEKLEREALLAGRAVILYKMITDLIEEKKVTSGGTREQLKKQVESHMRYYTVERGETAKEDYLNEPLQYLLNRFKGQVGDRDPKESLQLEDERFKAEEKAMLCDYLMPMMKEIMEKNENGSFEIEKLKEFVRNTAAVDTRTVKNQIELLIYLNILRSVGNNGIALVEANKIPESIVRRLKKAAEITLRKVLKTTSKKGIQLDKYIDHIKRAYVK